MSEAIPTTAASPGTRGEPKIAVLSTDIILIDFVGFSTLDDNSQFLAMSLVSRIVGTVFEKLSAEAFGRHLDLAIGWVPTGDGFYIVLNPLASGAGLFAALRLRHILLTRINQTVGLKGVRFAVHHGSAVPFDDVTGKKNFIGTGLNDCARLLSLRPEVVAIAQNFHRDENSLVVSDIAADYFFTAYPRDEIQGFLDMAGWRQSARLMLVDKHNKPHHFYFVDVRRDNLLQIPRIIHQIRPDHS